MINIFTMRKIFTLFTLLFALTLNIYAIEVSRSVFPNQIKPGEGAVISVSIKKQGEEGFAKLMEVIPEGFRAEEMNSANGNFIAEGGQVRIIWLTMPEGEEFKAEYKLIYEGESKGSFEVNGKFYFVKDDKRTERVIKTSYIKVFIPNANAEPGVAPKIEYDTPMPVIPPLEPEKEEPIANNDGGNESDLVDSESEVSNQEVEKENVDDEKENGEDETEPQKPEVTISMQLSNVETVTDDLKSKESENIAPQIESDPIDDAQEKEIVNNIPPTAEGLIFKVQLGAYSKPQPNMSIFGDLPDVHYGKENGLYKYYSGSYTSEYEVRDIIKQAQSSGFTGAFLVRFKDGQKL